MLKKIYDPMKITDVGFYFSHYCRLGVPQWSTEMLRKAKNKYEKAVAKTKWKQDEKIVGHRSSVGECGNPCKHSRHPWSMPPSGFKGAHALWSSDSTLSYSVSLISKHLFYPTVYCFHNEMLSKIACDNICI